MIHGAPPFCCRIRLESVRLAVLGLWRFVGRRRFLAFFGRFGERVRMGLRVSGIGGHGFGLAAGVLGGVIGQFADAFFRQPRDLAGFEIVDGAQHADIAGEGAFAHGGTGQEYLFDGGPDVLLDRTGDQIGHGGLGKCIQNLLDGRDDVVHERGDVAFQSVAFAFDLLGYGGDGAALGVSEDEEDGRVHVANAVFDGTDFVDVADVSGDADDEEVHDAGVEEEFDGDSGVGAGDDGGDGVVALVRGGSEASPLFVGVGTPEGAAGEAGISFLKNFQRFRGAGFGHGLGCPSQQTNAKTADVQRHGDLLQQ